MVTPVEAPSLHLSISIDIPTVTDALLWLVTRSKTEESLRQNIPIWGSDAQWAKLSQVMREALGLEHPRDWLHEYLEEVRSSEPIATRFQLPVRMPSLDRVLQQGGRVRLKHLRSLSYSIDGDQAICLVEGKRYAFRTLAIPALTRLGREWQSLRELSVGTNEVIVGALLEALWRDDVIAVSGTGAETAS
jgi:hypothetical protein